MKSFTLIVALSASPFANTQIYGTGIPKDLQVYKVIVAEHKQLLQIDRGGKGFDKVAVKSRLLVDFRSTNTKNFYYTI